MHIRFSKFVLFFFAALIAVGAALAQSRVTGTVRDTTGAVAPGAAVIAGNVETGQITSAQSNPSGVYSISASNPGCMKSPASWPASGSSCARASCWRPGPLQPSTSLRSWAS